MANENPPFNKAEDLRNQAVQHVAELTKDDPASAAEVAKLRTAMEAQKDAERSKVIDHTADEWHALLAKIEAAVGADKKLDASEVANVEKVINDEVVAEITETPQLTNAAPATPAETTAANPEAEELKIKDLTTKFEAAWNGPDKLKAIGPGISLLLAYFSKIQKTVWSELQGAGGEAMDAVEEFGPKWAGSWLRSRRISEGFKTLKAETDPKKRDEQIKWLEAKITTVTEPAQKKKFETALAAAKEQRPSQAPAAAPAPAAPERPRDPTPAEIVAESNQLITQATSTGERQRGRLEQAIASRPAWNEMTVATIQGMNTTSTDIATIRSDPNSVHNIAPKLGLTVEQATALKKALAADTTADRAATLSKYFDTKATEQVRQRIAAARATPAAS